MIGPVAFQRQVLKRKLWGVQQELCNAIATCASVSVKGCHGSGKTFTVAGMVPYELLMYDEAVVLTVAPTLRQVKLMWSEIETAIQSLPCQVPDRTTTGWQLSKKCYAQGFSSSKGVNAQGFHGERVLILADEAVGISPDLWDAIDGIRAGGDVRLVKLCNPTVPSGAPFEDFTRLRNQTKCITISAFDTPNLQGLTLESLLALPDDQLDYAPFPFLTRRRWVKEMYFKWGPTNPRFMSRVLGEFPTQADNSVFSLEWIEKSSLPWEQEQLQALLTRGAYLQIGVDVAGPGEDETSAYGRIGPFVLAHESWNEPDARGKVVHFIGRLQSRFPGIQTVVIVDTVGIGFHMGTHLRDVGLDVRPFVAGSKPYDPALFTNWKAESYWGLREKMKAGQVLGISDEDTKAQLSDIRYRETPAGKIEIESKDESRKRGSNSPDRAEALVMAFSRPLDITPEIQYVHSRVSISLY